MDLNQIIMELNILLPQLANFIDQFNNTLNQTGASAISDSIGNLSIEVPGSMPEDAAKAVSKKIGIIDRLITTHGQNINDLLQKGANIENHIKTENPNYVSELGNKIEQFKTINKSYKH